jgi:hypothetical protein
VLVAACAVWLFLTARAAPDVRLYRQAADGCPDAATVTSALTEWLETTGTPLDAAEVQIDAQVERSPYAAAGYELALEQTGRRVAFLGLVDRLVQDDPETNAAQDEENDVLNIACNLLAARYASFSRKELLLDTYGRRKRGEDERAIVRALVGKVTGASPDAQDSFDLEGQFVMHDVLTNMFRLSEGFALKQLHVAPNCCWSSDSQRTRADAIRAVEEGLGPKSAAAIDVSSNHVCKSSTTASS